MTNKQLYFVNRSVLFLAIAYAINGYTLPALACSIISAFLTCEFIGYEKVKDSLMQVIVVGIVLIGMIRMVGLQVNLPMLLGYHSYFQSARYSLVIQWYLSQSYLCQF